MDKQLSGGNLKKRSPPDTVLSTLIKIFLHIVSPSLPHSERHPHNSYISSPVRPTSCFIASSPRAGKWSLDSPEGVSQLAPQAALRPYF